MEAELAAVREGVSLALQWCNTPVIIEVDCLQLVNWVQQKDQDLSGYRTLIEEIKKLMKSRQTCITRISRNQNTISHFLANYARRSGCTAVWLCSGPEDVEDRCLADCNFHV